MSFFWHFHTAKPFTAQLHCWPIQPGTVRIICDDGIDLKILTDDGLGNLTGDGNGTVDYSYGFVSINFDAPYPLDGTPVRANYEPVEGGCSVRCNKCATNRIRLDLSPGAITGQSEITISDAWRRLYNKLEYIRPKHVIFEPYRYEEAYVASFGHRFDIVEADVEILDTVGFHVSIS